MFSKATLLVFLSLSVFGSSMAKEPIPVEEVFPAESLKASTSRKEVNPHSEPKVRRLSSSTHETDSFGMVGKPEVMFDSAATTPTIDSNAEEAFDADGKAPYDPHYHRKLSTSTALGYCTFGKLSVVWSL